MMLLRSMSAARALKPNGSALAAVELSRQPTQRHLSFFSNLLGMRSKRLEKETKPEDKGEKDRAIREALLGDVIGRADRQAKKLAKSDVDRIIGGTYPPRGN